MTKAIEIKKARGWYSIYSGAAKLSRGFRTEAQAEAELEKNRSFYQYWAGSASASYENKIADGDFVTIITE
jgi:hypothetical protein